MAPQPPQAKVAAGGIAGSLTILIVYAAGVAGYDIPAEVASAFTVVVTFAAAYVKSP